MNLEELKYRVDSETGEVVIPKPSNGILDTIRNGGKEYVYMTGSFGMRMFKELIHSMYGTNPMEIFEPLLHFEYFKPMEHFATATMLEKKTYMYCRESEIREMKRMRIYIEKETDFYYKYN